MAMFCGFSCCTSRTVNPLTRVFIVSGPQLRNMEKLKEFGECIITVQDCVIKKFLQGFMAPKQKKRRKQAGGEESSKAEEVDEDKKLAEEARVSHSSCPPVGLHWRRPL